MKNYSITSIIFILPFLLLSGCAEDPPNAVGLSLLPAKDSLTILPFNTAPGSITPERDRLAGNSVYLLTGTSQGIEARTLLRYYAADADFPSVRIDSAVLHLRPMYRFKDSIGLLSFSIHPVPLSWNWASTSFTWDSLTTDFIIDTIAGSFSRIISPADTDIAITLDTTVVRNWIINGTIAMIFVPDPSCQLMAGFADFGTTGYYPALTVTYHDSLDTLHTFTPALAASEFIANGDIPSPSTVSYIQGAVAWRQRLSFDVTRIPSRATITDAVLEIHIDSTRSLFSTPRRDSIYAHLNLTGDHDSLGFAVLGGFTDSTRTVMDFHVNTIIQEWVTHHLSNYGIVLRSFSDYSAADRLAFYNTTADSLHRPTLRIRYTYIP